MTQGYESDESYFQSRMKLDLRRKRLWNELINRYFMPLIGKDRTVVELGAGWCDFINSVKASRKVAVDIWPGVVENAAADVEVHISSATGLGFLQSKSVDVVFASNLVEHLSQSEFKLMLSEVRRILNSDGRVILLQPNYRLCSKRYFDDYSHVSIWTDVSIADFLRADDWEVLRVMPRFLPLTIKSRLPVIPLLIRIYLLSPIKPMAGQMLVVARKKTNN